VKIVYVAGPMSADTEWLIELNVRAAEAMGFDIASAGAFPLIPHTNARWLHSEFSQEFMVEGSLALLTKCDAMIVCRGWESSRGTKAEMQMCEEQGIPYFLSLTDLEDWLVKTK